MEVIYFLATDGIKLDGLLSTCKDKTEDIKRQAKILDEKVISRRLEAIINIKKQLKQNTPFQLSVEVLFINMKENWNDWGSWYKV